MRERNWETDKVSKSKKVDGQEMYTYEGWAMVAAKFNGRDEEVAVSLPDAAILAGKVTLF